MAMSILKFIGSKPCQESGRMRGSVGSCPHHGLCHGLLSFLLDVYDVFDPSGKTLWLSVDHRRLRPVDDMVLLSCVVGDTASSRRVKNRRNWVPASSDECLW